MAKKKTRQNISVPKDFSNNPFESMKGLAVFEAKSSVASHKSNQKLPDSKQAGSDAAQTSFTEEMAFLGVKPLNKDEQGDVAAPEGVKPGTKPAAGTDQGESDLGTFLEAVGSMEQVFKDEWCEDLPEQRAVPRRMKQVERGQLLPEDELDLHGLTADEATAKILFFLQNAISRGLCTVLVITGKGLHSEEGPVLRSATERVLSEKKNQVVEWGVAPRRYGGEGALVIFLRQSGQKNP